MKEKITGIISFIGAIDWNLTGLYLLFHHYNIEEIEM